jgi:hypothetical protein
MGNHDYINNRNNSYIHFKWYGPGIDSASNRNEYQESLKKKPGGKLRPARRVDNLAAIC